MKKKNKIYLYSALGLFVIVGIVMGILYFPATEGSIVSQTLGKYTLSGTKFKASGSVFIGDVTSQGDCISYANFKIKNANKYVQPIFETKLLPTYTKYCGYNYYRNEKCMNPPSDGRWYYETKNLPEPTSVVLIDNGKYGKSGNAGIVDECYECSYNQDREFYKIGEKITFSPEKFSDNKIPPRFSTIICDSRFPNQVYEIAVNHNLNTQSAKQIGRLF